ncbi:hypothetical protein [Streptomyces sediminimaris]|uniref:hypothetical protein n=1 Tax=Streptomyces sediminimaris TaxID=3383721 RepID=UPI00399BA960
MDSFETAADWLERGRPEERDTAELGALVWSAGGQRAFERQDADAWRLTIVGGGSRVVYEVLGLALGDLR